MKKQGAGTIVNIGSVSGVSPYVGGGAYAATESCTRNADTGVGT